MNAELKQRYAKLLFAYPEPYRSEGGDEIVATLRVHAPDSGGRHCEKHGHC